MSEKKSVGPYTHVGYSGPPSILNFLADCHKRNRAGSRAHLVGGYPPNTPSFSDLSSGAIDLFARCFELVRDEVDSHLSLQDNTEAHQIALKLLEFGCQGKPRDAVNILARLAGESTLTNAVNTALEDTVAAARRRATLAAAGIDDGKAAVGIDDGKAATSKLPPKHPDDNATGIPATPAVVAAPSLDPTAYRPASEFLDDARFPTSKLPEKPADDEKPPPMPPMAPLADSTTLAEQTDPVTRAIALLLAADKEGKPIVIKDLPGIVGCHRSTLYRDPLFNAAVKAMKAKKRANIPKGSKTKEGDVEADYDPAEE